MRLTRFKLWLITGLLASAGLGAIAYATPINVPADCSQIMFNRCMNLGYFTGSTNVDDARPPNNIGSGPFVGEYPLDMAYSGYSRAILPFNTWAFPQFCQQVGAVCTPLYTPAGYADLFIAEIENYVNGRDKNGVFNCATYLNPALIDLNDSVGGCPSARRNAIGAAMIIDTMLGYSYNSNGDGIDWGTCEITTAATTGCIYFAPVQKGVQTAKNHIAEWKSLVRAYVAANLVDWDFFTLAPPHTNSTAVNYSMDDMYYLDPGGFPESWIAFKNPDGTVRYTINRLCANLVGPTLGLGSYKLDLLLTPPSNDVLVDGTADVPINLNLRITNKDLLDPNPPNSPSQPASGQIFTSSNPNNILVSAAPYNYNVGSLKQAGDSADRPTTFTIKKTATDGQVVCFEGNVTPASPLGDTVTSNQSCFTVRAPRRPFLDTSKGDVHAGGLICGDTSPPAGTQSVHGQPNTKADFVVSAGGTIDQFGSGGIYGFNPLTFGNNSVPNGFYGQVCRPDLVKAANAYTNIKSPSPSPNSYSVSSLSGTLLGIPGVVSITPPSGTLTLSTGTVPLRSTLLVNGNVYISGDININFTNITRSTLATFGLVATGNIYIAPGVKNLNGFYYAQGGSGGTGKFMTCADSSGVLQSTAACFNPLTLNGFAMANSFSFGRVGAAGTFGPVRTESINFLGALYLAPPPGFSDYLANPKYDNERPPLF